MEVKRTKSITKDDLTKIVSVIDLTSLNTADTPNLITQLCAKAQTPVGNVAAVCVYPQFIPLVVDHLHGSGIKIASVANFPGGEFDFKTTSNEIKQALATGAHEVDIVFPYSHYLHHNQDEALAFIADCKSVCSNHCMKVILETSAFESAKQIYTLSRGLISAGADFIKTSTGKTHQGATLETATPMLFAIKESRKPVGFKASGGIKTIEDALSYIRLAEEVMSTDWVHPKNFRIGASSLLDNVLQLINQSSW